MWKDEDDSFSFWLEEYINENYYNKQKATNSLTFQLIEKKLHQKQMKQK